MSKCKGIVAVATCNEGYFAGLLVTFYSLLKALNPKCRAHLVVLREQSSALNEAVLRRVLDWSGREYSLELVGVELGRFKSYRSDYGGSRLAYARLLIPEVVSAEQALYVDCDLVIGRDVGLLRGLPWTEECIAYAVRDPKAPTFAAEGMDCERVGIPPGAAYFNSGLLWLHLGRWREQQLGARCRQFMERYPDQLRWWDQSVLNAVLRGNWRELEPAWNLVAERRLRKWELVPRRSACGVNFHYVGPNKPWLGFNAHRVHFDAVFGQIAHLVPQEMVAYKPDMRDGIKRVWYFAKRAFWNCGSLCKQRLKARQRWSM